MAGDFEELVEQQVSTLRGDELRRLEAAAAQRRRAWVEARGLPTAGGRLTPREAYELFFTGYLGLPLDQVPVVSETPDEIVWRSANPCPTLEACARLGLDTRSVCRAVYEKSTQAFFSALDPELRFHRSYDVIRPHAPHCEERIVRVDFEALMRIAIEEAELSRAEGNKGYGAVIVIGDEVIAQAHDTAATARDPSLHAELSAIRAAAARLGDADLTGAVLISSCEACPMCAALAVWANVTTIVYGASIEETAAMGKARILVSAREVVAKSPALVEVIGGVLREECLALYA